MKPIQLAGCVIVDDFERMLLIHRSTDTLSQWEMPGGTVDRDETAEAATVRTIKQELGISVQLAKALGSGTYQAARQDYQFHWFHAVITDGSPLIQQPELFDDIDYFDLDDMVGSALSENMKILLEKFWSSEVAL
jgi:8-oxo-dGTP diphosphatase